MAAATVLRPWSTSGATEPQYIGANRKAIDRTHYKYTIHTHTACIAFAPAHSQAYRAGGGPSVTLTSCRRSSGLPRRPPRGAPCRFTPLTVPPPRAVLLVENALSTQALAAASEAADRYIDSVFYGKHWPWAMLPTYQECATCRSAQRIDAARRSRRDDSHCATLPPPPPALPPPPG